MFDCFRSVVEYFDDAVFGLTQRGAPKLIHNGYEYVKDRTFNASTNWRCCLFRRNACRARAITKNINGVERLKLTYAEHSHRTKVHK